MKRHEGARSYLKEYVVPKHEMKSVWADKQKEYVVPKHEMKLVWADV